MQNPTKQRGPGRPCGSRFAGRVTLPLTKEQMVVFKAKVGASAFIRGAIDRELARLREKRQMAETFLEG